MKQRSFRHQLVMLLIMSDFFKASLEVIYPATTLAIAMPDSNALCTATGFFSNFFVDATDFAILIIAVHTALCIFFPPAGHVSTDKAGLYRWRFVAYGCWFAYSVLMSSLAFLNKSGAYTTSVSWCFLPIRPFYWRVALSWGPRYVILAFIFIVYLSIFVYVKRKFSSFRKMFESSAEEEMSQLGMSFSDGDLTETFSQSTKAGHLTLPQTSYRRSGEMPRHESIIAEIEKPVGATTEASRPVSSRLHSFVSAHSSHSARNDSVFTQVRPVPVARKEIDPLRVERNRIVQQLRHLFIFPLMYLLMWMIPFVYHMTQYHDRFVKAPVVVLAALSAFIVPLHGFIDTVVYAYNEKPWRTWKYRVPTARSRSNRPVNTNTRQSSGDSQSKAETALEIQVTDCITIRQQQEIDEAQEKRHSRRVRLSSSAGAGGSDWWDLEEHNWRAIDEEAESEE
ncbi:Predicted protein [Taphrina deformans PYCC 5710]|uniref:G-protein coupled receptors family 1 profile domain-containing protein n=1 Tax=Taphrina deformans (strain PYCC 5710 / ATCC 11124 / CBS 356.35 / IMI 108563 / JCM 9778 / NBRC 8474) TaxID=1097556 RepID=R4XA98_TAPDE|nr:Predicted protein [Taphrina deformans PYCC 5710]|eukprot:CCG82677.1 Predicted protein [Taphrina deformans PYCC 5710]